MNRVSKSLLLTVWFHLTFTLVSNGSPNCYPTNPGRLRRDVAENNNTKNFSKIGIVERCMDEMGLESKEVSKLEPEQIGQLMGKIDTKYAYLESCTRRLECSTLLRCRILKYAEKYLPVSPQIVQEMIGTIEKQIKEDFENSSETLINGAEKLASIISTVAQHLPEFHETWNQMKVALESALKEPNMCRSLPAITHVITLGDVIKKLICAKDYNEALHFFKRRALFWKKIPKRLPVEDQNEMKLLTYDEIIVRSSKFKNLSSMSEIEYAKDFCKLEKLWIQKPVKIADTEVYAQCMGVLYFSSDPHILDLKKNLSSDSSQPSHVHNHRYCNDQSALWNVVSNIYEHTHSAEVQELPEDFQCTPGEEDFERFMKFLDDKYKDNRFSYVARSLI